MCVVFIWNFEIPGWFQGLHSIIRDSSATNNTDNEIKRQHALHEILSTEESYVKQLAILLQSYKFPLFQKAEGEHSKKFPSIQDLKTIFSNLDSIHQFSNTVRVFCLYMLISSRLASQRAH